MFQKRQKHLSEFKMYREAISNVCDSLDGLCLNNIEHVRSIIKSSEDLINDADDHKHMVDMLTHFSHSVKREFEGLLKQLSSKLDGIAKRRTEQIPARVGNLHYTMMETSLEYLDVDKITNTARYSKACSNAANLGLLGMTIKVKARLQPFRSNEIAKSKSEECIPASFKLKNSSYSYPELTKKRRRSLCSRSSGNFDLCLKTSPESNYGKAKIKRTQTPISMANLQISGIMDESKNETVDIKVFENEYREVERNLFVHCALKIGNQLSFNGKNIDQVSTSRGLILDVEKGSLKSDLAAQTIVGVVTLNMVEYRSGLRFYFESNGEIWCKHEKKTYLLARNFCTSYLVDGKKVACSGRGVGLADNHLVYITTKLSVVSLNLTDLIDLFEFGPFDQSKLTFFKRHAGPIIDFCYSAKKKYLNFLTLEGTIDRMKFNAGNVNPQLLKKVKLSTNPLFEGPAFEYTVLVAGWYEVLAVGYNAYTRSQHFVLFSGSDLQLLDCLTLSNQEFPVHCLRQLIRNRESFYLASNRLNMIHLLRVHHKRLEMIRADIPVMDGSIEGLRILSEEDVLVFGEQNKQSSVKRLRIESSTKSTI
jgi:hypothetical protein